MYNAPLVKLPDPVTDLSIQRNRSDGTFTAKWTSNYNVKLYRTPKKINFKGRTSKMEDLRSVMEEIVPIAEYTDKIRFSMDDGAVWYIYPVIAYGKTAVRGEPVCTTNLEPFRDIERTMVNKDCIITMTWPQGAIEAEFRISNSEIKNADDPGLERRTIRRKDYYEERQVVIPMGDSVRKFIHIYAKYKIEDDIMASRPVIISAYSVECRKVRYTASRDKKTMTFKLSADPSVGEIPAIMAVQSSERIPLRSGDGEVVWRSEGPVVFENGSATQSFECGPQTDMERIRLFFVEEADYNLFKFIHPIYRRR
ncbi:MAG: hypothetical protein IJ904_04510 [Candidatus Methanomethylophilaceae archaeon]|nr:hypothetical protein [Candidatus Methanomethylophilaceae archaeon]